MIKSSMTRLARRNYVNRSAEARHPIRCLMGNLITGDVDGMINYIHSLPGQLSEGRLAFMLRLSSHILLAIRALGVPHNEQAANEIVKEYVYVLMHYHVVCKVNLIKLISG